MAALQRDMSVAKPGAWQQNPVQLDSEVAAVVRWRPDLPQAWLLRAQALRDTQPAEAEASLHRAVSLSPNDWQAWEEMAELRLTAGDLATARLDLQQAVRYNHGFAAQYEAAMFALITGDPSSYWRLGQQALAHTVLGDPNALRDVNSLLASARQTSPKDSAPILQLLSGSRPSIYLQAVRFFQSSGQWDLATQIWTQMPAPGGNPDATRETGLDLSDHWLDRAGQGEAGRLTTAATIWNQLVVMHLLPAPELRPNSEADPCMQNVGVGRAFAWHDTGAVFSRSLTEGGRELQFSGFQSDHELLYQPLWFQAGGNRSLHLVSSADLQSPDPTGVALRVVGTAGQLLAEQAVPLNRTPTATTLRFAVLPGEQLITLEFWYSRQAGELPLRGKVRLGCLQLDTT